MPPEPMLILPGLALAYAMNSRTFVAGTEGLTVMTFGTPAIEGKVPEAMIY